MSAPRKYDQEFRERAVGLYRERLEQHDESKLAARRQVGVLLDLNPATLRNWVEDAERADGFRPPTASRVAESEEVRALRREVAELRRANEILKTASAFFAQAELDRRLLPESVRRRADLCRADRARGHDRAVHLLRQAGAAGVPCGSGGGVPGERPDHPP